MSRVKVGDAVIFHDSRGFPRTALITAIHGEPDERPCVNLIHVSADEGRTDGYGRQVERHTSIVHALSQPAHGGYWRFLDEAPNPVASVER
jgi:hypothetical protein